MIWGGLISLALGAAGGGGGGRAASARFSCSRRDFSRASAAKAAAEALTDTVLAGLYAAVLDADEAAELVSLVTSLRALVGGH